MPLAKPLGQPVVDCLAPSVRSGRCARSIGPGPILAARVKVTVRVN